MKKSLIALAALATVGAAQAQSSVTVYGSFDVGYNSVDYKNIAGGVGSSNQATLKGINAADNSAAGALTSNRIGFRGTEDLGGGLRANFNLEYGFFNNISGDTVNTSTAATQGTNYPGATYSPSATGNTTAGAKSGDAALQTRTSRVGLESAKLGRLDAGYGLTGLFATVTGHSPLPGNNFYGDVAYTQDGSSQSRLNSGADSRILAGAVRMSGIQYTTPTINGFSAVVDWGAGSQKYDDGSNNNAKVENMGLTARYTVGKLALAATTHKLKADTSTDFAPVSALSTSVNNQGSKVDYQAFSARYAVTSNLAVNALYAKNKTERLDTGAQLGKNDVTQVGVKYDMGKTSIVAQYGEGEGQTSNASSGLRDRKGYQLGAIYNLSKRTNVYALYGEQQVKYVTAASAGVLNNNTAGGAGTVEKVSGYAVGIRHSF